MTTSEVSLPAGTVAYDERGEGTAVVLLPSGAHDRRDYDELRDRLPPTVRTIAMDWPGHGDSPPPTGPGDVSRWADLAEQFVDHLGGAVVIGNSVGGFSAGRLAARRPDLVEGLVLIDAGGFAAADLRTRTFCALMGRPGFLRRVYPTFSARYMRARTDADRAARERAIANTRKPATLAYLTNLWRSFPNPEHDLRSAAIAVPTLILWGRRDPVIPVAAGRRAAELIPGATLLELDTGHQPHTSDPDAVAAAVSELLVACADGAGRLAD